VDEDDEDVEPVEDEVNEEWEMGEDDDEELYRDDDF
jgi:hypothetical protein